VPGLYLGAILVSFAGIVVLDLRLRLAIPAAPGRTAAAVAIGTGFFVIWDLVGIAAGVFVKGDSPLFVGVDLAPHLPLEEPFFLAFLCYLALVAWAGALRVADRRGTSSVNTDEAVR
jgi:lycopene cyclase domain-containing protein